MTVSTAAGGDRETARLDAVIFDMDGVLIDTEPAWRRVEIEVFGSLGVRLTEADCRETMGARVDEVVQLRFSRQPWAGESVEAVVQRIVAGVIEHVGEQGVAMAGALEAIATVRAAHLRCAVASSSPAPLIAAVLARLGVASEVDVICSAEDDALGKPAPDVYLRTAALLGVAPATCLAIEDSINGMLSALAAGMRCVVVPDPHGADDPRLAAATLQLASLRELDAATLRRLGAYLL